MSDLAKRVLIVTGQKPMTQVRSSSGGSSTLYEVYATDEHGNTIEEPLRTFAELEEGVAIEYEIKRYDHPQYGTSYTLFPPKRNTAKRLRELEEEVERIVRWAEAKGYSRAEWEKIVNNEKEREEKAQRAAQDKAAARQAASEMEPVPAQERPDLDERFGKDAPWDGDDLEGSGDGAA